MVSRNVEKIIGHPNYESATITNDACLLKLAEPLEWTEFVQPIALPAPMQVLILARVTDPLTP